MFFRFLSVVSVISDEIIEAQLLSFFLIFLTFLMRKRDACGISKDNGSSERSERNGKGGYATKYIIP